MDILSDYNEKFEQLCSRLHVNKYIFEITKLCGYSEFIIVHKKLTLVDLYKTVSMEFECKDIKELFFINNCTGEKIKVPITNQMTILEFIFNNNNGSNQNICPIFPVPCKIVYKLYFDDGHSHDNIVCKLNLPNIVI
jgi:hypothetical protein